ncbi:hypothetical protein COU57_06655 [Candidatus Pacearchaeota archaeon CG10_big_fil_rev_8_21_14_0_10_32_14]|nr:MAG: hypothetical protein COU57_06655 [Candidatus Pacearchaeota archaeon CG10_big_fil_rev_8_21_14_0_10_32_14]
MKSQGSKPIRVRFKERKDSDTPLEFTVTREFNIPEGYRSNITNRRWSLYATEIDSMYLMKRCTDETIVPTYYNIGIAKDYDKARDRLHKQALSDAELIGKNYGANTIENLTGL